MCGGSDDGQGAEAADDCLRVQRRGPWFPPRKPMVSPVGNRCFPRKKLSFLLGQLHRPSVRSQFSILNSQFSIQPGSPSTVVSSVASPRRLDSTSSMGKRLSLNKRVDATLESGLIIVRSHLPHMAKTPFISMAFASRKCHTYVVVMPYLRCGNAILTMW